MLSIDAQALFESINAGRRTLLIDVRQPEELAHGTLKGSLNFPLTDIPRRIDELEKLIKKQGKKTEIIIFCRMGGRSEQVISVLEQRGSRELTNLIGGTQKYSAFDNTIQEY